MCSTIWCVLDASVYIYLLVLLFICVRRHKVKGFTLHFMRQIGLWAFLCDHFFKDVEFFLMLHGSLYFSHFF